MQTRASFLFIAMLGLASLPELGYNYIRCWSWTAFKSSAKGKGGYEIQLADGMLPYSFVIG